jgi:hypothetical protein
MTYKYRVLALQWHETESSPPEIADFNLTAADGILRHELLNLGNQP